MVAYGSLVADGVREEGGGPWKCETGFDLSRVYICTPMLKSYIHMKNLEVSVTKITQY